MEKKPLGRMMCNISNLIRREIDQFAHTIAKDQVTGTNGWIVGYIAHHKEQDVFQRDLEEEFSITRSTASKVVELMVQKGFIQRSSVEYDARLKKLTLTPKGLEFHEKMKMNKVELEKRILKGFTKEEEANLYNYLDRIKINLEERI